MTSPKRLLACAIAAGLALLPPAAASAETAPRDGSHDFDFLIGSWKAHVRRLPERLVGSNAWIEYDGTSIHRKVLDSNANLEDFDVETADRSKAIHGETLRLYNPDSGQWSIYLLDLAKGALGLPPVVGRFTDGRGEFFDQEDFKGRKILVRYQWTHSGADKALMQQAFSDDGGKTWEVNWICDLTRVGP
jgi:hypothetical protein